MAIVKRIAPYVVVLVAAALLYIAASGFQFTPRGHRLGPDAWPKALLVLMAIACLFEIVKTLVVGNRNGEVRGLLESIQENAAHEPTDAPQADDAPRYPYRLALGIALTGVYVLLFDVLGFFLDTVAFTCLFIVVGRYRRPAVILATGALSSLAFMFVFMKVVYVSLPIGVAPFSSVSLALMQLMGIR